MTRGKKFFLNNITTQSLNDLAISNDVSLHAILEVIWRIILYWNKGINDDAFDKFVPINMDVLKLENILDFIINNIPSVITIKNDISVKEIIDEQQKKINKLFNIHTDLSRKENNDVQYDANEVKTIFIYVNNYDIKYNEKFADLIKQLFEKLSSLCFVIYSYKVDSRICIGIEENKTNFEFDDIKILINRMIKILIQLSTNEELFISELKIITDNECKLILNKFNNRKMNYFQNKTIVEMLEKQVQKTPDKLVLIYNEEKISYMSFNEKVNQIAFCLKKYNIKANDFVAIIAERSIELILGIYGVLKAGAAFVPIDASNPKERIEFILNDCKPKVILIYKANIETEVPIINLADEKIYDGKSCKPNVINELSDLAYCIYTSGTTGNPKGVMIEHISLINNISACVNNLYGDNIGITPLFTNHCYDFTLPMIFVPVLYGGIGMLFKHEKDVVRYLNSGKCFHMMKVTPTHYNLLRVGIKAKWNIKNLVFGGEVLTKKFLEFIRNDFLSDTIIHNEYGPTETTVFVTENIVNYQHKVVSIGKPILNTQVYIMKDNRLLCGIGIVGELCVAGYGVARGYLNQPELTAEKFIDNPFGEGKMYRTGDLAKWMYNGNIEFIGRNDKQTKIRGFRVELVEVEKKLCEYGDVEEAVVIIANKANENNPTIYGFLVSLKLLNINEVYDYMKRKLPSYMIPSHLVQIEKIPLTDNKKVDERILLKFMAEQNKNIKS